MSIAIGLLSLGLAIIAWPAGAVERRPRRWRSLLAGEIVTAEREA